MLNPLPFERDSAELLEAAALALDAVALHPPQAPPEQARAYAVRRRESAAEHAPVFGASDALPEAEAVFSLLDFTAPGAGRSAEALSREIERDARRFEAK